MTDSDGESSNELALDPDRHRSPLSIDDIQNIRFALGTRVRYWGVEKVLNGIEASLRAEERVYTAKKDRDEARVGFLKAQVLLEESDGVIEAERRRIRAEIKREDLEHDVATEELKQRLNNLAKQGEIQEMQQELTKLRLEQQLEKARSPKEKKKTATEEKLEAIRERATLLDTVDVFKAELFQKYGVESEEELPEDARHLLNKYRMVVEVGVEDD